MLLLGRQEQRTIIIIIIIGARLRDDQVERGGLRRARAFKERTLYIQESFVSERRLSDWAWDG